MKIAFITPGAYMEQEDYIGGNLLGTEYQIFELAKELVKNGCEIYILRRWHESGLEKKDGVNILSFKSPDYKSAILLTLNKLRFSRNAIKFLKNNDFDFIIMLDPFSSYFVYKLPLKKISITHSQVPYDLIEEEINKNIIYKIKIRLLKNVQKKFFQNSDIIISLNHEIDSFLSKNGYKSILIPNALIIDKYNIRVTDENYVVFGGRLVKEKNVDNLIKAYSMLNDNLRSKYRLKICGFGPERENLIKLTIELGLEEKVDFLPWLNSYEFINLISKCTVFVLPSSYEVMPVSLLEAMALNKPVIATDTYGALEIIKHDNGLIVERGNIDQIYENLKILLEDKNLRIEIGRRARKTIINNYSIDKISKMYLNLFNCSIKE